MHKIRELKGLKFLLFYILFYICSIGMYKTKSIFQSIPTLIQSENKDCFSFKFLSILFNSNSLETQSDSDENDEETEKKLTFSDQNIKLQIGFISKNENYKELFHKVQNNLLTHSLEIHSPPPEKVVSC